MRPARPGCAGRLRPMVAWLGPLPRPILLLGCRPPGSPAHPTAHRPVIRWGKTKALLLVSVVTACANGDELCKSSPDGSEHLPVGSGWEEGRVCPVFPPPRPTRLIREMSSSSEVCQPCCDRDH